MDVGSGSQDNTASSGTLTAPSVGEMATACGGGTIRLGTVVNDQTALVVAPPRLVAITVQR